MPIPPQSVQEADAGRPDRPSEPKSPVQDWLHSRARLMPDTLSKSPPWVRGVFDHSWAPMRALARQVNLLPPHLLGRLQCWESGYAVICARESEYVPGPTLIRRQRVVNVAYVSVEDLATDNEKPLHAIGHLIDHHLGCGGASQGRWLSSGGGTTEYLRRVGQRLPELYTLGHAVDAIAESSVQDYFAQSLALFCRDRKRLNVADPLIYKWFRSTLWDRAFWYGDPALGKEDQLQDG